MVSFPSPGLCAANSGPVSDYVLWRSAEKSGGALREFKAHLETAQTTFKPSAALRVISHTKRLEASTAESTNKSAPELESLSQLTQPSLRLLPEPRLSRRPEETLFHQHVSSAVLATSCSTQQNQHTKERIIFS